MRHSLLMALLLWSGSVYALSVTGDSPASGPISGGTTVTVTGTGFATTGTVTVSFGSVTTNANVFNDSALQCVTPVHAEGTFAITVTNPDASTGTLNSAFTFFDPAKAPTITSTGINPTFGPTAGGTTVTITGTNFFNGAAVYFGGALAASITVDSATQITAVTPAHSAGAVDVVVINTDTQSVTAANAFTFYAPPTISGITTETGFTPPTGSINGGQKITISGTGFIVIGNSVPTVTFDAGGAPANATDVVVVDANTITCTTPAHAAGLFSVTVTNPDSPANQNDTINNAYTFEISDYTWTGGGNSSVSWTNTANWAGGVVPPDDGVADVTITGVGTSGGKKRINLDAPAAGQFPNKRFVHSIHVTFSNDFQFDAGTNASSALSIQSGLLSSTQNKTITINVPLEAHDGMTYEGPSDQSISSTATVNGCIFIPTLTSTYPGTTNLTNAVLQVGGTSVIPGRSPLIMSGSLLDLRTGSTVVGSLSGGTNNALTNSLNTTIAFVVGVDNTDSTYAGAIGKKYTANGPFSFVKVGSGILNLSGDNLATTISSLEHIVSDGTLLVSGKLPSGSTETVNQDGILAGTGQVPATATPASPATGGSIQPGDPSAGNGFGVLTAASVDLSEGDLTLQIVGYTTVGTDFDQLKVTNALTLNANSRLTLDLAGLNITGTATSVVTYASHTGSFDLGKVRLINNPFGYTPTVIYNGTSIDIRLDPAVSTPAGIFVTPIQGLVTTQTGGTAEFTVVLNTQPTADVTIALSSSDTNAGTVAPASLTFTDQNFDQPQTVTVTGVNSGATGNVVYSIVTGAAVSTDTAYNSLNASDVSVINRGDGIVVTVGAQPLTTTESGGTATFTVRLSSAPTADVLIPITSSNTDEGQPSPGLLVFTSGNFSVDQTVSIIGVDDHTADGEKSYTISVGPAVTEDTSGYKNLSGSDISCINTDNECAVTSITPISGPINVATNVTIKGSNFLANATVAIGGLSATNVIVVDANTITATTPANSIAGKVDVKVTNPQSDAGVLPGGYIYFDPALAPTVAGINPDEGFTTGGLSVTIAGSKFVAGAAVTIGGVDATNVTVQNSTTITAKTAAINFNNAGVKDVIVINPDTQSATLSGGFTYNLAPAPTITNINPTSGSTNGGNTVTITGSGFVVGADTTTQVAIGGAAALSVHITGGTTMDVVVGPIVFTNAGAKNVVITNPDAQQSAQAVTYTYNAAAAPGLTSLSPNAGSTTGGTLITLNGTNFAAGALVSIDGITTNSNFVSATQITATTRPHAAGAVDVKVINADQQQSATLVGGFTYAAPVNVTNITPTSGTSLGGTGITIAGSGFVTGATVKFGGTSATTVNVVNSTVITAFTPGHAPGIVDVVVSNPNGVTGTLANSYNFIPAPAPTVSAISPGGGSALGGTNVTLTGTGFFAGATVTFGTDAATNVVVVSATSITATTPVHAPGLSDVTVTNIDTQSGTLANGFNFAPPPVVSTIAPTSGPSIGGTSVTITGTDFISGATVTFGGTAATNVTVTATQITATTPAHAAGAVDIVVKNPDTQIGTLAAAFTYIPPPAVTAITPGNGVTAGATSFTLTGTGFQSGATVTIGGVAATNVVVVDATSITGTTGAHAAGTVDVVATNPDTQVGTLTGGFIYNDPPVLNSPVTVAVTTVVVGQSVNFTISATDPQGMPLTITYNYGDGTSDTTGQHVYNASGTYTVTVTVSNGVTSSSSSVEITVKLAANLWVKKQSIKVGTDGKESWQAQYIFNADRTPGKIFDPAKDVFSASLGKIPAISINPPSQQLAGTKPKFSFKSAKGVIPATSVTLDLSAQSIALSMKNATIVDTVPSTLRNSVTLGTAGFSLDEAFSDKGAFVANAGYRTTAFVVAAAKVTAKAPGKDALSFSMLLGDPSFAFPGGSGAKTVRFKVTSSTGATIIDKDFTAIAVFSSGKFKSGKDTAAPAGKFGYDTLKGKMTAAIKGATLSGVLSGSTDHVTVDMTIGDKTYSTGVTLFGSSGSYSTKLPK